MEKRKLSPAEASLVLSDLIASEPKKSRVLWGDALAFKDYVQDLFFTVFPAGWNELSLDTWWEIFKYVLGGTHRKAIILPQVCKKWRTVYNALNRKRFDALCEDSLGIKFLVFASAVKLVEIRVLEKVQFDVNVPWRREYDTEISEKEWDSRARIVITSHNGTPFFHTETELRCETVSTADSTADALFCFYELSGYYGTTSDLMIDRFALVKTLCGGDTGFFVTPKGNIEDVSFLRGTLGDSRNGIPQIAPNRFYERMVGDPAFKNRVYDFLYLVNQDTKMW
jgi:hypothetical protein